MTNSVVLFNTLFNFNQAACCTGSGFGAGFSFNNSLALFNKDFTSASTSAFAVFKSSPLRKPIVFNSVFNFPASKSNCPAASVFNFLRSFSTSVICAIAGLTVSFLNAMNSGSWSLLFEFSAGFDFGFCCSVSFDFLTCSAIAAALDLSPVLILFSKFFAINLCVVARSCPPLIGILL